MSPWVAGTPSLWLWGPGHPLGGHQPLRTAFPHHAVTFINVTCREPENPSQFKREPSEHLRGPLRGAVLAATLSSAPPRDSARQPELWQLSSSLLQMSLALFFFKAPL